MDVTSFCRCVSIACFESTASCCKSSAESRLAERDVGHRVTFNVDDAGVLHFLSDFPCEVVRIDVEIVRDDEDRAFESIFLQDGVGVFVVVNIAVVEGQENGFFRQGRTVFEVVGKFFRRDGVITV